PTDGRGGYIGPVGGWSIERLVQCTQPAWLKIRLRTMVLRRRASIVGLSSVLGARRLIVLTTGGRTRAAGWPDKGESSPCGSSGSGYLVWGGAERRVRFRPVKNDSSGMGQESLVWCSAMTACSVSL